MFTTHRLQTTLKTTCPTCPHNMHYQGHTTWETWFPGIANLSKCLSTLVFGCNLLVETLTNLTITTLHEELSAVVGWKRSWPLGIGNNCHSIPLHSRRLIFQQAVPLIHQFHMLPIFTQTSSTASHKETVIVVEHKHSVTSEEVTNSESRKCSCFVQL